MCSLQSWKMVLGLSDAVLNVPLPEQKMSITSLHFNEIPKETSYHFVCIHYFQYWYVYINVSSICTYHMVMKPTLYYMKALNSQFYLNLSKWCSILNVKILVSQSSGVKNLNNIRVHSVGNIKVSSVIIFNMWYREKILIMLIILAVYTLRQHVLSYRKKNIEFERLLMLLRLFDRCR